jgi:hypothetical protein
MGNEVPGMPADQRQFRLQHTSLPVAVQNCSRFGQLGQPPKMIKDGRWTVAVSTGYGPVSHVGNFTTEEEANRLIVTDSKNGPEPADEPKRPTDAG